VKISTCTPAECDEMGLRSVQKDSESVLRRKTVGQSRQCSEKGWVGFVPEQRYAVPSRESETPHCPNDRSVYQLKLMRRWSECTIAGGIRRDLTPNTELRGQRRPDRKGNPGSRSNDGGTEAAVNDGIVQWE